MPLCAGLFHCNGAEGKFNWILVRHVADAERCVVFFPGDISNFAAGTGMPYSYSLEGLLWVLCCKFPRETVVLVRPRMMIDHFAAYVNFFLVDSIGNPRPLSDLAPSKGAEDGEGGGAEPGGGGLQPPRAAEHLGLLLASLEGQLGHPLPPRLALVGFSKGCAVLSALMRGGAERGLWGRVEAVHFVDPGLTVPGVFPVDADDLREVRASAGAGLAVWIHGTPRQMQDPGRAFVAEEAGAFAAACASEGIRVERRLYAEGSPPSLDMHFDALRCFFTSAEDEEGGNTHAGFFQSWARSAAAAEAG